jgi:hypothetical protein
MMIVTQVAWLEAEAKGRSCGAWHPELHLYASGEATG